MANLYALMTAYRYAGPTVLSLTALSIADSGPVPIALWSFDLGLHGARTVGSW